MSDRSRNFSRLRPDQWYATFQCEWPKSLREPFPKHLTMGASALCKSRIADQTARVALSLRLQSRWPWGSPRRTQLSVRDPGEDKHLRLGPRLVECSRLRGNRIAIRLERDRAGKRTAGCEAPGVRLHLAGVVNTADLSVSRPGLQEKRSIGLSRTEAFWSAGISRSRSI